MEDLRTLAARALAGGDYTPAESARVRAVPDTRTIRYYTTLGLLAAPAQMRGRTAFYSETHVLQIVAIKRLQASDLTLSDIQQRLVGLPNSRLRTIARLPDGFWQAADEYLEKRQRQPAKKKPEPRANEPTAAPTVPLSPACDEEFWLTPAALPSSGAEPNCVTGVFEAADVSLSANIDLQLTNGVRVTIHLPTQVRSQATSLDRQIDSAALMAATQPLLKELIRQQIIRP